MLALSVRPLRCLHRLQLCACYSSTESKPSPPQTEKTADVIEKPVPKDTSITSTAKHVEVTADNGQKYRSSWHQGEGEYFSFLRAFYTEESNASLLKMLQTPINLSPSAIKAWWRRKQEEKNIIMQTYLPQRSQKLGSELAAAHFIVYRGGAIKFYGENRWIKADEFGNYSLPGHFDSTKILEGIDCSGMRIHYEGLSNLRDLRQLKWLSFQDCETIDDWCLDRVSYLFRDTVVYLDLRECPNFSYRGLGALYKMNQLKILYVDNIQLSPSFEMTCLMLQQLNPSLDIRTD